jgi:DUF1365 family protein
MTAVVAPPECTTLDRARSTHEPVEIYEGTVRHRRFTPTLREFTPKLFLAYLDVDALPDSLDRLPLWSARRAAPVRFRARDFFDGHDGSLGTAVRDLVQVRLGRRPAGRVDLLAHLRTFGWLFNPLAVYYCWTADGEALDAVVLEVTNTPWHGRHWYVLDAQGNASTATTAKAMHVSPFLPMDVDYRIRWTVPGPSLNLAIEVEREHSRVFDAELSLRRRRATRARAVTALARYPMLPQRVSGGIYAKAARLFADGIPVYRHPARRHERSSR